MLKNYIKQHTLTLSLVSFALLSPFLLKAQIDSIIFKNNNVVIGEVKSLEHGVLQIETDYSDADFTLKWVEIKYIKTESTFLVTTSDGNRCNGTIKTVREGEIAIYCEEGEQVRKHAEIVSLISINKGFWSKVYASIDIGMSMTKANNYQQYSSNSNLGYMADRWAIDAYYNLLKTTQDSVKSTERIDYGLAHKLYLINDWYIPADISFLKNNEQLIDLRVVGQLGIGKYLIHTNRSYWSANLGGSYVNEMYAPEASADPTIEDPDKVSYEAYISSEVNLFDIGDLSLLSNIKASPSLTEKGRWRTDFNFTAEYEFPYDIYIKGSFSLNYDSQPVEGASKTDYVTSIGFGWSW